jgi:hypothetical protein
MGGANDRRSQGDVAEEASMHAENYPKLDQPRNDIVRLQETIADLERRIDKQAVLLRALFVLLRASDGLTEKQLLESFRQCEAERNNAPAKRCSGCGRTVNLTHNRCLYCDEPCLIQSAFEHLDAGVWPDRHDDKEHRVVAGPPVQDGITIVED